jgi:hypothetical protein
MVIGLHRGVAAILPVVLCAAILAGCSEEEQLLVPATGDQALERQDRDRQLRERALNQGESGRLAY